MNSARNSLVTLGSAAVLAVYSAGFFRTRAAAARFGDDDIERRRPVPVAEHDPKTAAPAVAVTPDTPAAPAVVPPPAPSAPAPKRLVVAAPSAPKHDSTTPAPVATGTVVPPDSTPRVDSAMSPDASLPTTAPTVVKPATPVAAAPLAVDTTTPMQEPESPRWKDGSYSGWGNSRHGSIQATVEIREGKIVSATITQCLTRYSCSWISRLPGQVVARQSPEVDYVSGATQSTNAFYYAVVEALSKAK